jgi:hypothetical protein
MRHLAVLAAAAGFVPSALATGVCAEDAASPIFGVKIPGG